MNTMKKSPYFTTAIISLLIHGVLLGSMVLLGPKLTAQVSSVAPIEVELVDASVIDTGNTLTESSTPATVQPQPERPAPPETAALKQEATTQETLTAEKAVQQEADAGVATVGIPNAVIADSAKQGVEKKPVVRTPASIIAGPRPNYPHAARQAGWEGTVVIRVLVGADGSTKALTVQRSSGYGVLDEAGVQAVKGWRFAPGRLGGDTVESYFDVKYHFNLADAQ